MKIRVSVYTLTAAGPGLQRLCPRAFLKTEFIVSVGSLGSCFPHRWLWVGTEDSDA